MKFIKKNSKHWFLIGATSLILSSWLLATIVDIAKSPSLYGLKSFSNETVKKVEAEFLFTLPNEASIEFVTFINYKLGRGKIARCGIVGTFTADEFMNKYVQFNIESKNEHSNYYKMSGFPGMKKDDYTALRFTEKDGQTQAIIEKSGFFDKSLFEEMSKSGP